ncbi:hypothetical protein C4794_26595, partial [Salmonella enterica subsp. enterica serovar Anatum]
EQKGGIMNTTPFPALSAETLLAVNTVGQWLAQNDFSGEQPYSPQLVDRSSSQIFSAGICQNWFAISARIAASARPVVRIVW